METESRGSGAENSVTDREAVREPADGQRVRRENSNGQLVERPPADLRGALPTSARPADGRESPSRREEVSGARGAASARAQAAGLPAAVQASVAVKAGEYDGRRLRSQREVIRDVMLAAAQCEAWLTLAELRALTRFGEASISAQLRHLRKPENGRYEVVKRHRDEGVRERPRRAQRDRRGRGGRLDRRGECLWEYQLAVVARGGRETAQAEAEAACVA